MAVLLLFTAKRSAGQNADGGSVLQGVVKDSSGAVIPGATITRTARSGGTRRTRREATAATEDLPPASYIGKWVTLFSRYAHEDAHSDRDGLTRMPANPCNFTHEWGHSALDVRNMLFLGGSIWSAGTGPMSLVIASRCLS